MDKIEKTEYKWKEKEVPELSFKPLKIIMGIGIVFSLLLVFDGGIENKISTVIITLIFFLIFGVIISVINNWVTRKPSKYIGQLFMVN